MIQAASPQSCTAATRSYGQIQSGVPVGPRLIRRRHPGFPAKPLGPD